MNKKTSDVALFRQLCCMGLPSEILIPEVMRHIKVIIPSDANKFLWIDAQGQVTNAYWEYVVPEAVELFVTRFLPEIERGESVIKPIRWALQYGKPVDNLRTWFTPAYYTSDLYNLVLRPAGQHHGLDGQVRSGSCTLGIMTLFRDQRAAPFDASEVAQFERLLPYVGNARAQSPLTDLDFTDGGLSGLVILNRAGRMLHCSRHAKALLFLSQNNVVSPGRSVDRTMLSAAIQDLLRRINTVFDGGEAPPPTIRLRNSWGEFVLKAHWLEASLEGCDSTIGVTIDLREPYALRLSRALRELPLSARQREVCLLLALRKTTDEIMGVMNVHRTTLKDHIRKIYDKLDVHTQDQLLGYLRERSRQVALTFM